MKGLYWTLTLLLAGAIAASAQTKNTFDGGGTGDLWNTGDNWSLGAPPPDVDSEWAEIRANVTIDATHTGTNAACFGNRCSLGPSGVPAVELNMTGGTLYGSWGHFSISFNQWQTREATFNMSGGTFFVGNTNLNSDGYGSHLLIGRGGDPGNKGHFNMTGGTVWVADDKTIFVGKAGQASGFINLDGGTIYAGTLTINTGQVDITEGTLILDGDDTSAVQALITAGTLTAYDDTGTVVYDYDTSSSGKTTVTASAPLPQGAVLIIR